MKVSRISASSYSNTAPLIWSFLYGTNRGKVEVILDTAPSRSAELLAENRVDAALVPVIAYQLIENVRLFPKVCVGAKEKVKSVCLVTKGRELRDVKSVSLDVSSKTSVALTKIIFREFLNIEPVWTNSPPNLDAMLSDSDCALLIGDPALLVADCGLRIAENQSKYRVFDLAEVWKNYTNFGFVFAMWMTQRESCEIDFVSAKNEGLLHLNEIIANYENEIPLSREQFNDYLTQNIAFEIDDSMQKGLQLYYQLAQKHKLIERDKPLIFVS